MDNFAARIAQLPPEKRALLELRLKQQSLAPPIVEQSIPRRVNSGSAPLSFAQQRLWFLDQLEPGSALYNVPGAYCLNGPLDFKSLEQSLNEIVRRHEVLRTTFRSVDGSPLQVASSESPLLLPVVDLSDRAESERQDEARRIAADESRRPFDLEQGPLMRVLLLRLDPEKHVLLLTMHHIVCDGWSMGILFRELSALYNAFRRGNLVPFTDLPIQYADYAVWQREWLQGPRLETQLSYWRNQLKNLSTLQLPTDRPRPRVQSYRGARRSMKISKELAAAIKTKSSREGVTLFMILLAAFQALLYRYTGQDDVVVGSPIAGRNRIDIEPLIGFFVNTLVFRSDFSRNPTFQELLGLVREIALDAYAHQDVPFEKLVEELQPDRNLGQSPLFQVAFQLQNTQKTPLRFDGLTVSRLQLNGKTVKFDLSLTVQENSQGLAASLGYNTDLFDAGTIDRILRHFHILLEGMVANPERRISDLPLLMKSERHQLLVEWNDTRIDYPKETCIHELFEEQVKRTPNATAVVFTSTERWRGEDQQLTYRELNQRANQLAHYLRKLGVGPEVLVGIYVERSLEMMVGLLGILKAGGAYVPLDPEYPPERLAYVLEDTQAPVLLTQKKLLATLAEITKPGKSTGESQNRLLVCLDRGWNEIIREGKDNPENQTNPENLAYVIYTSGSTGRPKGVQIPHSALVNFLCSMRERPGLTNKDTLFAVTTLSFDIAGLELYLPLMVGARLVIADRELAADGARLAKKLTEFAATTVQATPVTWQMLLEAGWKNTNVPKILCGGEALPNELSNRLLTRSSSLWNMYGPTETTIWSALNRVEFGEGSISIGRPIANTQIYILDRCLQPVPVGVTGELYVGGAGLSRGYLREAELTAKNFLPDPFSFQEGARLYRTGDLARYLANGNIQFLGRIDNQVKIRAYRIELGEIEIVLAQRAGVGGAVVLAREDVAGEKRLVAYVSGNNEPIPTVNELQTCLKQKLPQYMVPSHFVFLNSLPLTPNGKVDRNALPPPDGERPEPTESFVAPRTPVEERLAGIWSKLLGVNQVGIRDNFFDLGGHSLLAVRLFAEIEKAFNQRPPLSSLFQEPTIEHLAKFISHEHQPATSSSLVVFQAHGSRVPFFCVHTFFGDVLCYMNLAGCMGSDQPFYAIEARGLNGTDEPFDDIKVMAAYYIEQIRAVRPQGPYALGGLCSAGIVAFEMAHQLRAKGEEWLWWPCSIAMRSPSQGPRACTEA